MRVSSCLLFVLSLTVLSDRAVQAAQWVAPFAVGSLYAVEPTADGGFIAAGETGGGPASDVAVFKLDGLGKVVWQWTYGGIGGDRAYSVRQTVDGGYVVAGFTGFAGVVGTPDAWVLKLDPSGAVVWRNTYGGNGDDVVYSIEPTGDGGFVLAGATYLTAGFENAWVLKLDASGNVAWQRTYGGVYNDAASSVHPTADGGYIVAGNTWSFGAGRSDAWVLKLDGSGSVVWQKTYGGAGDEAALSVVPIAGGGYVVAGNTNSFGAGGGDAWVLKLDASGNVVWQKTYGEAGYELATSIVAIADGAYVVAGQQDGGVWLFRLDDGGNIVWQRTYSGESPTSAYSVRPTADGGYVVAVGWSASAVLKVDANGAIAGCASMGTSSASATSSSAATGNSTAMVVATSVTPASGPISQANGYFGSSIRCFVADAAPAPAAADIPTLSQWAMGLLAGLLGCWGAAMNSRIRTGGTGRPNAPNQPSGRHGRRHWMSKSRPSP